MTVIEDIVRGACVRAFMTAGKAPTEIASEITQTLIRSGVSVHSDTEVPWRPDPDDEATFSGDCWCEWPINSGWSRGTCGRSGTRKNAWGIRLCWQHEDALVSEALQRISAGVARERAIDVLVQIALSDKNLDLLERGARVHGWEDAVDRAVSKRLEHYSDKPFLMPESLREKFDDFISHRINETWGEPA